MDCDLLFKALADPTRRAIFERLAQATFNSSELREGLDISQPAVSQHLGVLLDAGLVRRNRQGRFVRYEVDPAGIASIGAWLNCYRAYWAQSARSCDFGQVEERTLNA